MGYGTSKSTLPPGTIFNGFQLVGFKEIEAFYWCNENFQGNLCLTCNMQE